MKRSSKFAEQSVPNKNCLFSWSQPIRINSPATDIKNEPTMQRRVWDVSICPGFINSPGEHYSSQELVPGNEAQWRIISELKCALRIHFTPGKGSYTNRTLARANQVTGSRRVSEFPFVYTQPRIQWLRERLANVHFTLWSVLSHFSGSEHSKIFEFQRTSDTPQTLSRFGETPRLDANRRVA